MMYSPTTYRYSLDSKRPTRLFACPQCQHRKFKRYVDTQTGDFLEDNVGRCNRENTCGHHYTPQQFFTDYPHKKMLEVGSPLYRAFPTSNINNATAMPVFDTIEKAVVLPTLRQYEHNNFVQFLRSLFHQRLTESLCERFSIGTARHWHGATIFWQRDLMGNFRTGEVKQYNKQTGKRDKNKNQWAHSILQRKDFRLQQCLFGLYQLLTEPLDKPIAIVESAKTAILMTAIYPKYIWLATCGAHNLNEERLMPLHGRNIILYPDTDEKAYAKWQQQSTVLQQKGFNITLSNLLFNKLQPEQRAAGYDMADALLHRDEKYGWQMTDEGYPLFWDFI